VPRPWDNRGCEKRRQTRLVCRGFSQSLARKRMVRLEERDRCGTDRHKPSLNLGYTRVKESNRISLTGKIENPYLLAVGGE